MKNILVGWLAGWKTRARRAMIKAALVAHVRRGSLKAYLRHAVNVCVLCGTAAPTTAPHRTAPHSLERRTAVAATTLTCGALDCCHIVGCSCVVWYMRPPCVGVSVRWERPGSRGL